MKRFRHKLLCEALEDRCNPAGIASGFDHISSILQDMYTGASPDALPTDAAGRVLCRVTTHDVAAMLPALEAIGFHPTAVRPESYYATGWLPLAAIPAAEALGDAGVLGGVIPTPIISIDAGITTSQGADVLGSTFVNSKVGAGYTGAGIKVGVISDSFDKDASALTHYAQDKTSGDLPNSLFYLDDAPSDPANSDEGRAMMQIVYDVAPGASLGFATYGTDEDSMAGAVNKLVANGANVIIDDVTLLGEPVYQDGPMAKAYTAAAAAKVVGISNAGNYIRAYEQVGFATTADPLIGGATFLDFNTGAGVDARNGFTIPAGAKYYYNLQWDDPFFKPGNVLTNLDLYLVQAGTTTVLKQSLDVNPTNNTPSELLFYTNATGAPLPVELMVRRTSGPSPGRVHLATRAYLFGDFEYNGGNAIIGSNGAANVISVAAAAFDNQRVPEDFTSLGTTISVFTDTGTRRLAPLDLVKPDITGPDNANTSFFGNFAYADGDSFPNFGGTSAASPHIAGVAALMLEKTPTLLPAQIKSQLIATAQDIHDGGWDRSTGAGMVDAFHAVYGAQTSASVAVGSDFTNGFEVGLGQSWRTYGNINGRVRIVDNTVVAPPAGGGSKCLVLDGFYHDSIGTKSVAYAEFQFNGLVPELQLSFQAMNLGDEPDTIDGVYITNDNGNTFVTLLDLNDVPNAWTSYKFDLHAAAAAAGQALNANSRIRFYQYDDSSFESTLDHDGFAFDQILLETTADAVTRNWLGGAPTNNWNEATNWFPSGQPNANDVVFIPAGAFVNINSTATAKTIYSYGTLNLAAGGVTNVSQKMETYGVVQWFGGVVNNNGTWTTHNSVTWNDGAWDNGDADTGKLVISAGKNFTLTGNYDRVIHAGNIENYGNTLWYDGSVYSAYGGAWKNMPGSTFTVSANDDVWAQRGGYPGPATAMTVSAGSTFIKDSNTNDIRFDGPLNLQGTVNITTGRISGNGGGDFRTANITGLVELDGGTFTSSLNSQYIQGTGRVIVNGAILSMPAGKVISFNNLDLAAGGISDLGTMYTLASFNWTGGFFESAGTSAFGAGCTTTITGPADRIIHARLFENYGPATWSDGTIYSAYGGNWVNKEGSSFTITSANNDNWLQRGGYPGPATAMTVDSGASFIKDGGAADVSFDGPLNVQGNFSISGGPVSGRGGGSVGHATVSAVAVGRIDLEGGTFNAVSGGKFTGTGGFRVNGGTLTNIAGERTTFGTLDLAPNGVITGAGTLAVTLYSNWTGGLYDTPGGGVTEFAPSATVYIDGSADRFIHARTFHNFGEAYWDDGYVYGAYGGNWINKAGSKFIIRHTDDNWLQRGGYPAPCTAMTVESGATLIKGGVTGTPNDVNFDGALNIAGNFEVLLGAVSGRGGGTIGHPTIAATGTGGRIELEGGTFNAVNGGKFTGTGRFALTGGILDIADKQALELSGFDLDSGYTQGSGTLTVTGNSVWKGGGLFATGVTNFTSTANLQFNSSGDHFIAAGTVNNFGTAIWNDGYMYGFSGGNFINKPGSSFTIRNNDDHWVQRGGYPGPCTAFTTERGSTLVKDTNANDVLFNGALNIGGDFNIVSGAVSGNGGGSVGSADGPSTGTGGRIELEGGIFNAVHGGVYTGTGRFALTGGILDIADSKSLTLSGFDLDSGYTQGPGTLTVTGNSVWKGGGLFATGVTNFTSTANLQFNGSGDHYIRSGTVNNFGNATWNDGYMYGGSGGNFINKAGSTFTIRNDDDNWVQQGGVPGPCTAFSTDRGSMLVKDTKANDVRFDGALNIGGDFNMISGTISGFGGGSVGSADGPSVGTGGRIELEGGVFTGVPGGVYTGAGRIATTGGLLEIAAGKSLTLSGLDLVAGGVSGLGTLTVTAGGTWTGGGMFDAGTTVLTSTAVMNATTGVDHFIHGRLVNNSGTFNWSNGYFRTASGGEWTNLSGSKVNITTDDDIWTQRGGYPGPITTFTTKVGSTLTRDTNATAVEFYGPFSAAGDVTVSKGSVSLLGGGNIGTLAVTQGALRFSGGTFNVFGNASVAGAGGLTVDGGIINITAGASLSATNTFQSNGQIAGDGNFFGTNAAWTGGWHVGPGTSSFSGTVTVSGPGDKRIYGRPVINNGTVLWTGGNILTGNGNAITWTNGANSTFDIQGDFAWGGIGGYPGPVMTMTNAANSLLKKSAGVGIATFGNLMINAGTVQVQTGTLQVAGDYVQSGGRTIVTGVLDPTGTTTTLSGGTLEGTGTVLSNLSNTGGSIKPGMSPGTLSIVGSYTQSGTGVLDVELNGTAAGFYDKLDVLGSVSLGGTVKAAVGYGAATNDKFTILANDGSDAVTGTFNGLPEGGTFTAGAHKLSVSYVGGDGNDIVLTRVAAAVPNVTTFTVNNGDSQRSRLTTITVNFDNPVLAADYTALGAITLQRTAVSSIPTGAVGDLVRTGPGGLGHITVTQGTATSLVLTFDNNGSFSNSSSLVENGSLTDGYWKLIIGGYSSTTGDPALRRLFGDSGVGSIGVVALTAFGNDFNGANPTFDFNNDGVINTTDLTAFGNRFGNSL